MALVLYNIKVLLNSLRNNGWYITGFPFHYNDHNYAVVFEDLREIDRGTKYYAVCLTFIDMNDETRRLETYANSYNFKINDDTLYDYFGIIAMGNTRGNPIFDLYNAFNNSTPTEYIPLPQEQYNAVLSVIETREGNEGLCCYEARHNPCINGIQYIRTAKNTTKTKLLRPNLFELIGKKDNHN